MAMRFKKVAEVFEDVGKMRRVCESSGSEHSAVDMASLSELVKSYIENEGRGDGGDMDEVGGVEGTEESESLVLDLETKDLLKNLLLDRNDDDDDGGGGRMQLLEAAEEAWNVVGGSLSQGAGFKRGLMSLLRNKGYDAGLCKSGWERNGKIPAGDYEYVDVNFTGSRYIIEVNFAEEFKIARPTERYKSLLEVLPSISVCKVEELKQVVRLMCNAMKKSMKEMDMPIPPWRRHAYVQTKWFGSYKRTTNEHSSKQVSVRNEDLITTFGFVSLPRRSTYCREDLVSRKVGMRVSKLTMEID